MGLGSNVRTLMRDIGRIFSGGDVPIETTQTTSEGSTIGMVEWLKKELGYDDKWTSEAKDYMQMDQDIPEIAAALDIRANNVCQAGFGDPAKIYEVKTEKGSAKHELTDELEEIDENTQIRIRLWSNIRRMNKFGDSYSEQIFAMYNDKRIELQKLKTLDPRYIRVEEVAADREGEEEKKENEPEEKKIVYNQYGKDSTTTTPIATLDEWQVLHFRASLDLDDKQGQSLLKPLRRLYRQLIMMEESFIIHHLSRARLRFAWLVETGGMSFNQADAYIKRLKKQQSQKRVVNSSTGRVEAVYDPKTEDSDFYVPLREGRGDIKALNAPANAKLDHILYFISKISSVTAVPKVYLGYEGEMKRQLMTPVDIQLARAVRRDQFSAALSLADMYYEALVVKDEKYKDLKVSVSFPPQGLEDELVKWETLKLKTEIGQMLLQMKVAPREWVVRNILELPVDEFGDFAKEALKEHKFGDNVVDPSAYADLIGVLEDVKDVLDLRHPIRVTRRPHGGFSVQE